jgi:hypothetical protein
VVIGLIVFWPRGGSGGIDSSKKSKEDLDPVLALEAPWLDADREVAVARAIKKGIGFLRKITPNGSSGYGPGGTAFAGFTLLHCGVSPDDPHIQKIVHLVRQAGPTTHTTYSVSAMIFFLDLYYSMRPEQADRQLLRSLALRLMGTQQWDGGWNYQVSVLNTESEDALEGLLHGVEPKGKGLDHLKKMPLVNYRPPAKVDTKHNFHSDNSNTQFALMALWVARRHGVSVDRSLAMVDQRFRSLQNEDGSWYYVNHGGGRRDAFTAAGLIALAVGRVVQPQVGSWEADEAIVKAFRFLGKNLGSKPGRTKPGGGTILPVETSSPLSYLWAVERVGVLYDRRYIEGKDWYSWGVDVLLPIQNAEGSWNDQNSVEADTCFALLFLKRVNLARDLTQQLRMQRTQ